MYYFVATCVSALVIGMAYIPGVNMKSANYDSYKKHSHSYGNKYKKDRKPYHVNNDWKQHKSYSYKHKKSSGHKKDHNHKYNWNNWKKHDHKNKYVKHHEKEHEHKKDYRKGYHKKPVTYSHKKYDYKKDYRDNDKEYHKKDYPKAKHAVYKKSEHKKDYAKDRSYDWKQSSYEHTQHQRKDNDCEKLRKYHKDTSDHRRTKYSNYDKSYDYDYEYDHDRKDKDSHYDDEHESYKSYEKDYGERMTYAY